MEDYNNNNAFGETILHKIKLFTKESYFNYFKQMLLEKSKNFYASEKISSLSFSIGKSLEEEAKKILTKKEIAKKPQSSWNLIMLLICNIPSHKKMEYIQNEFNLNPICYMYLTLLCHKKIKLLISFSNANNISLDILVKFYLDLCLSHINLKEFDNKLKKENLEKKKVYNMLHNMKINQKNKKQVNAKDSLYEKKNTIFGSSQVEYTNSFTRLFIGDIDPISVRERYLSNIFMKKVKQMYLYSSYTDLSQLYLKRFYNKLFNKDIKSAMDCDMIEVLSKFKNDTKKVENFQRNSSYIEKRNMIDHYVDEEKDNLEKILKRQKDLYMDQNKKNRPNSSKNLSLSTNIRKKNRKIMSSREHNFNKKNNSKDSFFNNKSRYSSSNKTFNRKINFISPSKNDLLINNSYKMGSWCTINHKIDNKKKIISDDLRIKNAILKRNNNIIKKMKNKLDNENKRMIQRKINLKNYLHNDDFFFTKIY